MQEEDYFRQHPKKLALSEILEEFALDGDAGLAPLALARGAIGNIEILKSAD